MFKKLFDSVQKKRDPHFLETNPTAILLHKLMQIPPVDKNNDSATYQEYKQNWVHQIDTLALPTASGGYKFLTVVVDIYNHIMDAEPIKINDSKNARSSLIKIYERGILKKPHIIESDQGSEFKGLFSDYLKHEEIRQIVGSTNRHRQQAIVEHMNNVLGRLIFYLLNYKDLQSKTQIGIKNAVGAKDWFISHTKFRQLIDTINEHNTFKPITESPDNLKITDENHDILPIGSKVYVTLDQPQGIINSVKLHGGFRAGDIRYDPNVKTIEANVLKLGQPPLYRIKGDNF